VAAVTAGGERIKVHVAGRAPRLSAEWRVVELRTADGARPLRPRTGERIALAGGGALELIAPYASSARLALSRFHAAQPVEDYLARHGEPIRYAYVPRRWPLEAYQNVYATTPGSAEMPSAGRPFTAELITRLMTRGIVVAPVTLHAGLSSPERHEPPLPEYYDVPPATARLLTTARRVIAVGTTVVRALESVADARSGWTNLVVTPDRGLRAVDGLLTGWHEPEASHLLMLEAAAGPELLARSYAAALDHGYLWHEFGDSHLILP
jgi:S-adenosylmethionine:tRNA ribosyltransferase-isomerase